MGLHIGEGRADQESIPPSIEKQNVDSIETQDIESLYKTYTDSTALSINPTH